MDNNKEVTTKPELSETTVDDILSSNNISGKKAKQALAEIKEKFTTLAFETEQLNIKKKRVEMELKKHPTIQAYDALKKEIRKNKKQMEQYAAVYQGGLQLAKKLGIRVDMSVIKMIKGE